MTGRPTCSHPGRAPSKAIGICLDVSNYDADAATPETAAALAAAGVTDVIVGCQVPAIARQQIGALRAAGIRAVGVYAFLYFGLDTAAQTSAAIEVTRASGIARVWLDVESTVPNERAGLTPAGRCAELRACVGVVERAGLECGIYTGGWYWVPNMANTREFAHLPLWHAEYPGDRHLISAVSYGGWNKVAVHQYASDIPLCGRERDLNHIFEGELDVNERLDQLMDIVVGNGLEATCFPGTEDLFPTGTAVTPEGEWGPVLLLTGEEALAYAVRRGFSLVLGLAIVRGELARHTRDSHGGPES